MIFTTPLALLLLLLLPVLAYLGWPRLAFRRRRDTVSLLLRLTIVTLIVFGLAGLHISRAAEKLSVVFLVDVSDSMDSAAQAAALDYVREAMRHSGASDESAVILFGSNALVERPMLPGQGLGPIGSRPGTLSTNLAEAIRLGMALFPTDAARRMVVLSDGVVTAGDAAEAARLAAAGGAQIDFVPFSRQPSPEIMVTDVQVPTRLNVDEPFEIDYTVTSDTETAGIVSLLAGGQTLARARIALHVGENRYFFRLDSGFPATGFSDIRIQVEPVDPAADGFYQNNQLSAFTEITGPSRVLMVAREGAAGAADVEYLLPALQETGLDVERATPGDLPIGLAPLSAYASVILVNVPAADLSPLRMEVLRTYVRDLGGGLVVIGGDRSYGVGGYFRTPLEDALPVEMQIRDQERLPALSLIFVIDKSGSMGAVGPSGYSNIDLAKEAIIRSVALLNPTDRVGVVGFDTSASWVVQPTPAENINAIQAQVATLRAGGGTDIRGGLQAAASYLPNDPSTLRHVILLSDGGSDPSGIPELVERMRSDYSTTVSVVAIGDGYAPFLRDVAAIGRGNFHFTRDVSTIPSIFTAETVLATRSYIVEEEVYPAIVGEHPILTGIASLPPLFGYVASTVKDTAQLLMRSPIPNSDPVLAAWQFGLGRSVAWTSDATARWAVNWLPWEHYTRFFDQMVRWTITEGVNSNLEIRVETRDGEAALVVDARDRGGDFLNGLNLDAGVVGPDLQSQVIPLFQVAPGRYEGLFTPGVEGAYFIRVAGRPVANAPIDVVVAQTSGWVLAYSPEYRLRGQGADLALLNAVANLTGGGSLEGRPADVFRHDVRVASTQFPLWPWLLLAALLLLPFDVGVRRLIVTRGDWRKLTAWVQDRLGIQPDILTERARAAQLDRLRGAKERARPDLPADRPPELSAVDTILPADERRQPTAPRPAPDQDVGAAAASAAALAAHRRAVRDAGRGAEPARPAPPAPAPAPPEAAPDLSAAPRVEPKPMPKPESAGSTASQLLKRKRQRSQGEAEDEGDS